MIVKGRIVNVESASKYTDGKQRVTIKVEAGGMGGAILIMPNSEGWGLDQELELEIRARGEGVAANG